MTKSLCSKIVTEEDLETETIIRAENEDGICLGFATISWKERGWCLGHGYAGRGKSPSASYKGAGWKVKLRSDAESALRQLFS